MRVTAGSNTAPEQQQQPQPFPTNNVVYQQQPPIQTVYTAQPNTVIVNNMDDGYEPNPYQTTTVYQPGAVVVQPGVPMMHYANNNVTMVQQPLMMGQVFWAPVPQPIPGVPLGLEYLTVMDSLLVKQKKEWLEVFSGFETSNKYVVLDKSGRHIYFAAEHSDFCSRQCCGSMREFDLGIYDNAQRQIMNIHRPLSCTGCCCPCCLQSMEVQAPPGNPIGYIYEEWACCIQKFRICNEKKETILRIRGPCCTSRCCGSVNFNVLTADGKTEIGKVAKKWTGIQEMVTDADNFGIEFPMDLDVNAKATLLAACFLIDFMYFEDSGNNNR